VTWWSRFPCLPLPPGWDASQSAPETRQQPLAVPEPTTRPEPASAGGAQSGEEPEANPYHATRETIRALFRESVALEQEARLRRRAARGSRVTCAVCGGDLPAGAKQFCGPECRRTELARRRREGRHAAATVMLTNGGSDGLDVTDHARVAVVRDDQAEQIQCAREGCDNLFTARGKGRWKQRYCGSACSSLVNEARRKPERAEPEDEFAREERERLAVLERAKALAPPPLLWELRDAADPHCL
jgi:hypothetical protein